MNSQITNILVACVCLSTPIRAAGISEGAPPPMAADFYVSPSGSDANAGGLEAPFKTVARARDAVRKVLARKPKRDVIVALRGGVYPQTKMLVFGPQDSGTDECSVTYAASPGERVVLSGGRRISGWRRGNGDLWVTDLADVAAGKWYFRQLFIDGKRAVRARTPNADAKDSWWRISSSSATKEHEPGENAPITVQLTGNVAAVRNPSDVELVYMQNNESGRKRLASIDANAQTLTLSTPNRWNPKTFLDDWLLSVPLAGKPCFLENALEFLDEPGEWYLDRVTGRLYYWPRPGEDMLASECIAPELENTILKVEGTRESSVVNLHFKGIEVSYVDWPLPAWGYMALFCCNVADMRSAKPGHRAIDGAVEVAYARSCSFKDGKITHAGAMGICMREGTSRISVEGNEIGDLGGGAYSAGWPNSAAGYLDAAPPPLPGEFSYFRVCNNEIHDCGADYFGAVGVLMMPTYGSEISHNLIYDTAYIGIAFAGSQDPKVTFDGDNIIGYNEIHDAMVTTIDGAGLYVTFAQNHGGTRIVGNIIHRVHGNPNHEKWGDHPPSAGVYLDSDTTGGLYEDNVLYNNPAAGPLIFDFFNAQQFYGQEKNTWRNNIIQKSGSLPVEFLDAELASSGLEPAYRARLTGRTAQVCRRHDLSTRGSPTITQALQFDFPCEGKGVIQVIVGDASRAQPAALAPIGMAAGTRYKLRTYVGQIAPEGVWGPGKMPMVGNAVACDPGVLGLPVTVLGHDADSTELILNPGAGPRVIWIVYQATVMINTAN